MQVRAHIFQDPSYVQFTTFTYTAWTRSSRSRFEDKLGKQFSFKQLNSKHEKSKLCQGGKHKTLNHVVLTTLSTLLIFSTLTSIEICFKIMIFIVTCNVCYKCTGATVHSEPAILEEVNSVRWPTRQSWLQHSHSNSTTSIHVLALRVWQRSSQGVGFIG